MAVTLASAWRFFWECNVAGESETKPVDPVVRGCAAEPRNLLADGSCISRFGEQLLLSGHGAEHILCTLWLLIWKYSAPPPLRRAAMGEKHHHHHPIFCNSALPFVTDVLLSCLIKTSTSSAAPYPSQQLWCSPVVPGGVVRRLGPVLVLGWPPRRRPPSSWLGGTATGGDGCELSNGETPPTDALEGKNKKQEPLHRAERIFLAE